MGEADPESRNAGGFQKLENVNKHIVLYSLQDGGQTWLFAGLQFLPLPTEFRALPTELYNNKFMLFEATKSGVACYSCKEETNTQTDFYIPFSPQPLLLPKKSSILT